MSKALSAGFSTCFGALLTFIFFAAVAAAPVYAASSGLVISQVYGGGGNTNAPFTNDFIEIFNRGNIPLSLNGLSLQYTSASGTGNLGASGLLTVLPNVTLQPGQYFLAGEAGGATGSALPSPDVTGPTNMSATGGKVALVNSTTSLGCNGGSTPCNANQLALIIDLVGYDGANFFEGAAAPTLSNTTAALRNGGGCTDTDNNAADFAAGTPQPRNTASAIHLCGQSLPPTAAGSATPGTVAAGDNVLLSVNVNPGSNPTSTGITVVANLSAIGGSANEIFADGGNNTFSFQTVVPHNTSGGSLSLPFLVSDAQGRSSTGNIGLTITAPPDALNIHTIQGSGLQSPIVGHFVETTGIVTALKSNGFFIQNADGEDDGDPNSSEGLFVFTSSAPPVAAAVGNRVRVRGTVAEFKSSTDPLSFTSTELSGSIQVTLISTGNALPTPITLTAADAAPGGSAQQLEKYQAMRVKIDSMTVVAPTQGSVNEANATSTSNGVFFGVVTGVSRPFREPGIQTPENLLYPTLCCIPVFDGNSEHIRVDSDAQPGSAKMDVATGDVITDLTGVLDYNTHEYTILPDPGRATIVTSKSAVAVPVPGEHEITIAAMNMERFFDGCLPGVNGAKPACDDPNTSDVVLTPSAFANRLNKASLIIRTILNMPDIIGVEEMENLSTLQAVAAKIQQDAGAPQPIYSAYLVEGNDIGGIDVGLLVKTSRIAVTDVRQFGKDTTFTEPGGMQATLNDRPPLVLDGSVRTSGKELPLQLTVIVNHLRSLNGIDDETSHPPDGPRVRAKRLAQAHDLAGLIQSFQAEGKNVVSIGDYNALSVNDGFVDVMGTILGTPAPPDQDVLGDGTSEVSPPLTDLLTMLPAEGRYSYSFDGDAQILDHIVVNEAIRPLVSNFVYAHDDADFPEIYRNDPNRPERLSDHDQALAYITVPTDTAPPVLNLPGIITVEATSPAGAIVTFTVTGNDAVDGPTSVTCDHISGATYPLGTTVVSCSSTDSHSNTGTGMFAIKVQDTTAPLVSVTGVSDGANYTLGAVPVAGCSTTDAVSGVANLATVQITGGTVNGTGKLTATCSGGSDKAGNIAAAVSVRYNVGYVFNGFFAPLGPGNSGPFKAGSTVPLKWQLKNAGGAAVGSLISVTSIQMAYNAACTGSADDATVVADSPGNSGLRFDGTTFGFNWKTPSWAPAGCYSVLVGLDDGSSHSQIVTLK